MIKKLHWCNGKNTEWEEVRSTKRETFLDPNKETLNIRELGKNVTLTSQPLFIPTIPLNSFSVFPTAPPPPATHTHPYPVLIKTPPPLFMRDQSWNIGVPFRIYVSMAAAECS